MRILIAGGPRTGKTTLAIRGASERGILARHTDSLIAKFDWSGASAEVSRWFDAPGPWIIEGVAVPRALRKWLAAHPTGKPADRIFYLTRPRVPLTSGQIGMGKGCLTVWREIEGMLRARGVEVILLDDSSGAVLDASA